MSACQGPKIYLTGVLFEIAAVAGMDAAMAVARAKGGVKAYFPARPKEGHWLVDAVGMEAARTICTALVSGRSGLEIDVPIGPAGSRDSARQVIETAYAGGMQAKDVVRLTGVSERTVRRHFAKLKAASRQRGEPRNCNNRVTMRREIIGDAYREGKSPEEAARLAGVTVKTAQKHFVRLKEAGRLPCEHSRDSEP